MYDVLLCGLECQHSKEKLPRETDLTLDKVVATCKASELSSQQIKELQGAEIDQVYTKIGKQNASPVRRSKSNPKEFFNNCRNCGKSHFLTNVQPMLLNVVSVKIEIGLRTPRQSKL